MKRILFALAILALVFPAIPRAEAGVDVSIDFFYNNLGDDGSWVDVDDYGYCWQPNVAVRDDRWRPYADGYWAYTDLGWTWVSYERFGWATYHYGRWARVRNHGWLWVPGREWGPAWVSWRTGGDYVGWAPLPPRRHYAGGEVVYEGRPIGGQVDIEFDIGPSYYNFVDVRYIGEPVLRERIYAPTQNINYINNTVNVTNITYNNSTVYNYGPDYNRLSAYSTRPIQRLAIQRETNVDLNAAAQSGALTKVQGNTLVIAAPQQVQKPAQPVAPKVVKQKIAKPDLETGWTGVSDPKAKADLQQKMKTEDPKVVPPPKLPPTNPAALTAPAPTPVSPNPTAPTPATATIPTKPGTSPAPVVGATPVAADKGKGQEKGRGGKALTPAPTPVANATPVATPPGKDDGKNKRGAGTKVEPAKVVPGKIEPTAQPTAPTPTAKISPSDALKPAAETEKGKGQKPAPIKPAYTPGAVNNPSALGNGSVPTPKIKEPKAIKKQDSVALPPPQKHANPAATINPPKQNIAPAPKKEKINVPPPPKHRTEVARPIPQPIPQQKAAVHQNRPPVPPPGGPAKAPAGAAKAAKPDKAEKKGKEPAASPAPKH